MLLLLTLACTPDTADVHLDCAEGFERHADGQCYPVEGDDTGEPDTDTGCELATWYADTDGDTWGDDAATVEACGAPDGYVARGYDCDDGNAEVYPKESAEEVCNGIDDTCDGVIDEDVVVSRYVDADGDGYGGEQAWVCEGEAGYAVEGGDCDDGDAGVWPGAADDTDDDVDQDCDGESDEDFDPCSVSSGSLEWSPSRLYENTEYERSRFYIEGRGIICEVTCSDSWLGVVEYETASGEPASLPVELGAGGSLGVIMHIYNPGTGAGTEGHCEARTSAGTVSTTVVWNGA